MDNNNGNTDTFKTSAEAEIESIADNDDYTGNTDTANAKDLLFEKSKELQDLEEDNNNEDTKGKTDSGKPDTKAETESTADNDYYTGNTDTASNTKYLLFENSPKREENNEENREDDPH